MLVEQHPMPGMGVSADLVVLDQGIDTSIAVGAGYSSVLSRPSV